MNQLITKIISRTIILRGWMDSISVSLLGLEVYLLDLK